MKFALDPIPHSEAVKLITEKPAVAREVFDQLPAELKGRAFTITGIEDFDVLQAVRDEIAKLPAGVDWDKVKGEVAKKISPWFDEEGALARAEFLLGHHGRQAYAATNARVMDEMLDIFPYRQYHSSRTSSEPRASHRALDGMIFPADHSFWDKHTPPWEFGCKCLDPTALTEEDFEEERGRDKKRPKAEKRVADAEQLRDLERGFISRGADINEDVRTPKQLGGKYEWSAKDATLPYDEIKTRWDEDVREAFEEWAAERLIELGFSLLDLLNGESPLGKRA